MDGLSLLCSLPTGPPIKFSMPVGVVGRQGERQNVRLCGVEVMGNSKKMLAFLLDSAAYGLPLFVTMPNLSFPHLGLFSLTLRGQHPIRKLECNKCLIIVYRSNRHKSIVLRKEAQKRGFNSLERGKVGGRNSSEKRSFEILVKQNEPDSER